MFKKRYILNVKPSHFLSSLTTVVSNKNTKGWVGFKYKLAIHSDYPVTRLTIKIVPYYNGCLLRGSITEGDNPELHVWLYPPMWFPFLFINGWIVLVLRGGGIALPFLGVTAFLFVVYLLESALFFGLIESCLRDG